MKLSIPFIILLLAITGYRSQAQNIELDWVQSFGNEEEVRLHGLYVTPEGEISATGGFPNTIDVDTSTETFELSSPLSSTFYNLNWDTNSEFIWANQGEQNGTANGNAICQDTEGNTYTIGVFNGTVDFAPGSDEFLVTNTGQNTCFIMKTDVEGNLSWVKVIERVDATSYSHGTSITTDSNGNIFVAGFFAGVVDFDDDPDTTYILDDNIFAFNKKMFYAKFTSEGELLWVNQIDSSSKTGEINAIDTDINNNLLITGHFTGNTDFDPGEGEFFIEGISDAFVLKVNNDGELLWVAPIISTAIENDGKGIKTDPEGNVYTVGIFGGIPDFDPSEETEFNLTASSSQNTFVQKLDPDGNLIWATAIESIHSNSGDAIDVNSEGQVYITGTFAGLTNFGSEDDVYELDTDNPIHNIYMALLDTEGSLIWAHRLGNSSGGVASSIKVDEENNVYLGGYINTQTDFDLSSETFFEGPETDNFDAFIAKYIRCISDEITFSQETLTEIHVECEAEMPEPPIAESVCGYIVTATTTMEFPITTPGTYSITWEYETSDGSLFYQTQNINISTIDNSVTIEDNMLTAEAEGYSYQWVDCNNDFSPIPGATEQTFTPETNGSYAVEITNNEECFTRSECTDITNIGIGLPQYDLLNSISLHPTPVTDVLHISSEKMPEELTVTVFNISGQEIQQEHYTNTTHIELNIKGKSGIYFIELKTPDGNILKKKIVKH